MSKNNGWGDDSWGSDPDDSWSSGGGNPSGEEASSVYPGQEQPGWQYGKSYFKYPQAGKQEPDWGKDFMAGGSHKSTSGPSYALVGSFLLAFVGLLCCCMPIPIFSIAGAGLAFYAMHSAAASDNRFRTGAIISLVFNVLVTIYGMIMGILMFTDGSFSFHLGNSSSESSTSLSSTVGE